jgi:type VI secretion system secreted protein VgrG
MRREKPRDDRSPKTAAGKDKLDKVSKRIGIPAVCALVVEGREIKYDISKLELHQSIDDHHVLKITLREIGQAAAERDFSESVPYTSFLGKSLSLTITPEGETVDASRQLEFIGVVTKVDLENSIDALNVATITAHSPTIAMDGARHNAFYHDQNATDIIGSILRQYPITLGTIDSAPGSMKFCVQYRETDFDFIARLAGESGLFALYDGKEFRLVKAGAADVEELVWRETLGSFTIGWGTESSEFSAQVYNYEQKKTYSQDTESLPPEASLSELSKISPDASKEVFTKSGFSTSPKVVADAQSLDKILQRDKGRAFGRMITCTGHSIVPAVAAGHCVKIGKMDKFNGVYWVGSVKHTFDESGTYHNSFTCTPLDIAFPQSQSARGELTNLQTAVVLDNNDPESLGRIKVQFPWNESDETPWVRMMTPHAGQDRGWFCLPEIGDEVLVGYEQGCPDLPVALGALYNKENAPHADTGDDKNSVKMFLTRSGNKLILNDTDGGEQISIITKDNKSQIVLDAAGPTISIESEGDISIKGNNISLESQQEFKIKSGTNLKTEAGANLETEASAKCDIKGATVTVSGNPIQLN